jgi:LysM repeat protein
MKNQRFVGLVLAAHITLGAAVLLLSGCTSAKVVKKGPKPGDNVALAQGAPRPINPAFNGGLGAPTRPAETTVTPTNEAGAVLEPVAAPVAEEYTVAKGDTLSSIARSHGISVVELRNANNLSNEALSVGQKITIPAPVSASPTAQAVEGGPAQTYVVVKGDTLARIAKMYGVSVADLKAANNLQNGNVKVGQKLTLPTGSHASPKWVASATAKHNVKASKLTYKVQKGDTVGSISSRAGVKAVDLMELNGISEPRKIRVGQTLKLPVGAKAIASKSSAASGKGAKVAKNGKGAGAKGGASAAPATVSSSAPGMLPTDIFAEPSAPAAAPSAARPAPAATTGSGLENLDAAPTTPTVPVQSEGGSNNVQP